VQRRPRLQRISHRRSPQRAPRGRRRGCRVRPPAAPAAAIRRGAPAAPAPARAPVHENSTDQAILLSGVARHLPQRVAQRTRAEKASKMNSAIAAICHLQWLWALSSKCLERGKMANKHCEARHMLCSSVRDHAGFRALFWRAFRFSGWVHHASSLHRSAHCAMSLATCGKAADPVQIMSMLMTISTLKTTSMLKRTLSSRRTKVPDCLRVERWQGFVRQQI